MIDYTEQQKELYDLILYESCELELLAKSAGRGECKIALASRLNEVIRILNEIRDTLMETIDE